MSQSILFNGTAYEIPDTGDSDWGENLTDYFVAIPQGALQKTGGSFTLSADVDFGPSFGPKVIYVKSNGTNISSAGFIRMTKSEGIGWRNNANGGNLLITIDGSDNLLFNGNKVLATGSVFTNNSVLITDNSGVISTETTLAKSRGGSGQDNSSLTFPASGTLATLDGAETFTNKTFGDAQTLTQVSTPSNPASGKNKFYVKSDGNLYVLSAGGIETQVGTGAGGGLKNYLGTVNNVNGNGNFELGSTSKWSLFNTTLTGVIPTGSISAGAASIDTFQVTNSGPLAGVYSLNVGSSGAITAGQGFISDAFTLDSEDKAQALATKFYYEVLSGAANLDFSGTDSNTWAVYIRDVTNSAWIQPAGVYNLVQNSGAGISTGTMQTTANSTQYRLAVICVNASAGASSMLFDDFFFGPQITAAGAAMSDWAPTTVTGSWVSNTTYTAYEKRIGDSAYYSIALNLSGAPTAANLTINLPSGRTIDTAKIISTDAQYESMGNVSLYRNGSRNVIGNIGYNDSTSVAIFWANDSTGNAGEPIINSNVTNTSPDTYGNGDLITLNFSVPITGWSAQTVMSNDTDTRVVAASGNNAVATALNSGSVTQLPFGTTSFDTHGAISNPSTTWTYTVPVSGYYQVTAGAETGNYAWGAGKFIYLYIYINGVNTKKIALRQFEGAVSAVALLNGSALFKLTAGDTITIYAETNEAGIALSSVAESNYVDVQRVSGPATIAASETVSARYTTSSSPTLSDGVATKITFGTKDYDDHDAYSSGTYTIGISGVYSISSAIMTQNAAFVAGDNLDLEIYKNGSAVAVLDRDQIETNNTRYLMVSGSTELKLLAGDTIEIYSLVSRTGGVTLQGDSKYNYFSIIRTGN